MLAHSVEADIAALAAQYGAPRRIVVDLAGAPFDPIGKPDRHGEVCMAVCRPNGRFITAIKHFYPPGAFRLLTGGVNHGEPIGAALLRETSEETGLTVTVRDFPVVIEYRWAGSAAPVFATFVFVLDEIAGELASNDPDEQVAAFREVAPDELPALAAALEALPDDVSHHVGGSWRHWGQFRAVVHRELYDALHA